MWCGVVECGAVWWSVVWCGVVECGVVWCGVVWCGVMWCGVVWCGGVCFGDGGVFFITFERIGNRNKVQFLDDQLNNFISQYIHTGSRI